MKTRLLIADDHIIFVEGLKMLFEPFCSVLGLASDGRALISLAEVLQPDVIVSGIGMPRLNGLDACEALVQKYPLIKVLFLTAKDDPEVAEEAFRRGAFGYALKKVALAELFTAIQTVADGRFYISPALTREPAKVFVERAKSRGDQNRLTMRQREVLQLLAEGKSMKEAANLLHITTRTIAFHKYAMMDQLGITRNSSLINYAVTNGLCCQ